MGIITGKRMSAHLTNSVISAHSLEIDMIYDPFPALDIDDNDQSLDKLKKKPTRGTESDEIILLLFLSYILLKLKVLFLSVLLWMVMRMHWSHARSSLRLHIRFVL